jgi:hypothetical protein
MANNYSQAVATNTIPCSRELYQELEGVLEEEVEDLEEEHGFEVDLEEGQLHMFTRSECSWEVHALPLRAREIMGRILEAAQLPWWEFGYHFYCDKARPGEFGGGRFRIHRDGSIEFAGMSWNSDPAPPPSRPPPAAPYPWAL